MYKVCIDTGGTFTDCVVSRPDGTLIECKSPSTPPDFSKGVMNVLEEAAVLCNLSLNEFLAQTETIIHGTTAATNALVTRNVAKTAMITTEGFRDILEMRRSLKIETHSMYEAYIPPYEPIIPRYLRYTVKEETLPTGEVTCPVDPAELKKVIAKIKKEGCQAVTLCFINSYINGSNEKYAAMMCRELLSDVFVCTSSDILPKMGEYERISTSVICACLGPVVETYMRRLEDALQETGFKGRLLIIQANQYVQSVDAVLRKPAYLMGSGPAAAPAGAAFLGELIEKANFITADMGGTTLDSALVTDNEVMLTSGMWVEDDRLGFKVVDVSSIGAGGGSIGSINALGLLQVGPGSAGADPGPACYDKGGENPTVTDAAVVLGYVDPVNFWGGKMPLDKEKAISSLRHICESLNMNTEQAAAAMYSTVCSNMADGIAEITTRQGHDVRKFALLAIGGGGGLTGAFMASILGLDEVIVPRFSSAFSAWGMFALDMGRDYLRSYFSHTTDCDFSVVNSLFEDMISEACTEFEALQVADEEVVFEKSMDVRYTGQYHELEMILPSGEIAADDMRSLEEEFHVRHQELFTFSMDWVPIEIRNLRLIARVKAEKKALQHIEAGSKDATAAIREKRSCYFNDRAVDTVIYDGIKLKANNELSGPAIIEESTTTTVIPEEFTCQIDTYGNYILRRN